MSAIYRLFRARFFVTCLLSVFAAAAAYADEAGIKKSVAAFFDVPEAAIESVKRIPQGGLYEILFASGELLYTDEAVSFVVAGSIIDTGTGQNITRARIEKLSTIDFKALPLKQAIKRVNGNGKRTIVTFEDPYCGFCKRLAQELQKVKDVTIYTFLFPMLSDDSVSTSRHIWCAKDKAAAWKDWIIDGKAPKARDCDSTVIDRNVVLARELRIGGTPAIFLTDGSRIAGYRDADTLEQALAAVPADSKK